MTRPKPHILAEQRIGRTDYYLRIQQGEGHWVVVYDNQPINIVRDYYYGDRKKYTRNGFAHPGHAENLARKLNRQFSTDLFSVRKII